MQSACFIPSESCPGVGSNAIVRATFWCFEAWRFAHRALLVDMVVPVAMISGFMRPSSVGPMEEKKARLAKRSAGNAHIPDSHSGGFNSRDPDHISYKLSHDSGPIYNDAHMQGQVLCLGVSNVRGTHPMIA